MGGPPRWGSVVTYLLCWRDFEAYAIGRDGLPETKLPINAEGESLARQYVWRRFRQCNDPLVRRSLFPKTTSCEPQPYNDASHWDAQFRQWAKLKSRDGLKRRMVEVRLLGPSTPGADDDPLAAVVDPGAGVESTAVTSIEVEVLRESITSDFNTDVTFGPEIQQAMLEATYNLGESYGGGFFRSVEDELIERLPDTFRSGSTDPTVRARERQTLKRALDRARRHVRDAMEDRTGPPEP